MDERDSLEYRIIVDGVSTVDPSDPERRVDPLTRASSLGGAVPRLSDLHLGLYTILDEDGRTARFIFRGASGEM